MNLKAFFLTAVSPLFWSVILLGTSGCAVLHKVQLGQIDARDDQKLIPFEIMMSETGVSAEEIGAIARAAQTNGGDNAGNLATIIALFQMGPQTGNPVYSERYAEKLIYALYEKCPTGRITGLMSIRETRKYPVISGEIVKVTGFCRKTAKSLNEGTGESTGKSNGKNGDT